MPVGFIQSAFSPDTLQFRLFGCSQSPTSPLFTQTDLSPSESASRQTCEASRIRTIVQELCNFPVLALLLPTVSADPISVETMLAHVDCIKSILGCSGVWPATGSLKHCVVCLSTLSFLVAGMGGA